jgi:tetratricopeptide (TPR) repeat protein
MGEYEQAITNFDQAIELDPVLTRAYLHRGYAYDQLGSYNEARADFEKAQTLDPEGTQTYLEETTDLETSAAAEVTEASAAPRAGSGAASAGPSSISASKGSNVKDVPKAQISRILWGGEPTNGERKRRGPTP